MIASSTTNLSIAPYTPSASKPWNARRIAHLYQRLGFGANLTEINNGLNLTPDALVDQLLDNAAALGVPTHPVWADWTTADYNGDIDLPFVHRDEIRVRWGREMLDEGIRSKMAFFWSNHFVTQEEVYICPSYMWEYYEMLHVNAFGNFKTFVELVGKDPSMLVYLNGNENIASQPNENYARELMELFTMGEGNGYTQTDIEEVARALTGWQLNRYNCEKNVALNTANFDNNQKTIFGQTGNWGYDEVHNLIFTQRANQVADYICTKIYQFFVYETPDPTIISALATTFQNNNWELMPVFKQLFKSEHFYEEKFIGANIKSPLEAMIGIMKTSGMVSNTDVSNDLMGTIVYYAYELGQDLFNPVDVAGWPEYRAWINENTLTARWSYVSTILNRLPDASKDKFAQLARDLTNISGDVEVVNTALVEHFLQHDLDDRLLASALDYFKGEIPSNYFVDGTWNLYFDEVPDQILNLLNYLLRLPEFQLS